MEELNAQLEVLRQEVATHCRLMLNVISVSVKLSENSVIALIGFNLQRFHLKDDDN